MPDLYNPILREASLRRRKSSAWTSASMEPRAIQDLQIVGGKAMKKIEAIIRKEKLEDVKAGLDKIGISGVKRV